MKKLVVIVALVGSSVGLGSALAADAPDDVVTYRHTLMESVGKHMKMGMMVTRGKVGRSQDMVQHALAMLDAAQILPDLFPEGTGPGAVETASLAAIWKDRKGFLDANRAWELEATRLLEVARTGDTAALATQLGKVGEACGACHDKFRKKDDH